MNILIDFVNVQHWTVEAIAGIYRRYGVKHTGQGDADGYESFVSSRNIPDINFNVDNLDRGKSILEQQVGGLHDAGAMSFRSHWLFPGDDGFARIFDALAKSQEEYRGFLDECIRGNMDLNFVNSRISLLNQDTRGYDIKFQPGDTTWTPNLWLFPHSIRSIEEYIDTYGIIFPLYRGEGEIFSLTMRCKHCGNYFLAKTKRAEFCRDQCRKDHFRLKK